jgi:4-amino-4-deoxy-L-arabinose transferase-like glycosyltransferase
MATLETTSGAENQQAMNNPRWVEWFLIGAILLLAGALRMAAPGLTEFKADEARLLALAYDMAGGEFALRGISSSVGLPNFPASVWLYALPSAIWRHPYAATIFTGLLSTLAVALTYWFVRRYWGIAAAITATLMYAVSPWAVIFSRKIWAQNLLPLFVMGWVIGAALALVERRPRFLWLHFVCLALAVQIHLAAVALIPATIVLLFVFRRNIRWQDVLIGGLLGLLTVIPFALYLSRDFDLGQLFTGAAGTEGGSRLSFESIRYTIMISLGTEIHSLAGAGAFEQYLALMPNLTAVHLLWGALIAAGVGYLAWKARSEWEAQEAQAGALVLIWLAMPALVFLWQWTPVFLHYFIAVLPAPYVAAGAAFGQLIRSQVDISRSARRLLASGAWIILLVTVAAQVGALVSLQNFVSHTATPGGYDAPLAIKMETVQLVKEAMAQSGAAEVLIAGEGDAPLIDEFPAEWDVLLRDMPHRFVDVTRSALFPAETSIVLLDERLEAEMSTGDLYQSMAEAAREIRLRPGEGSYRVLTLAGEARPKQEVPVEPVLLANWVNLLGHDVPERIDGESAVWQVHWRTGDNPDPQDYAFFNHLIDGSGARIGQVDGPAFDPGQWRAGDTVIGRFIVPWPEDAAGPFTMRVGMYRYPSLENVPLLDEAANPYADAAEFAVELE